MQAPRYPENICFSAGAQPQMACSTAQAATSSHLDAMNPDLSKSRTETQPQGRCNRSMLAGNRLGVEHLPRLGQQPRGVRLLPEARLSASLTPIGPAHPALERVPGARAHRVGRSEAVRNIRPEDED